MTDEEATTKPNRRAKAEPKAHRQVISKPMGMPEWSRTKSRKDRDKDRGLLAKDARKSYGSQEPFAKDMGPYYGHTEPKCTACGHSQSIHPYSDAGGGRDSCNDCGCKGYNVSTPKAEPPKTVTGPSEKPEPIPSKVPKPWAQMISQHKYIPPHIRDRAKVEQSPQSREISHRAAVALKLRRQFHGTATDKMGKSEGDACGCGHVRSDHQMIRSDDDPTPRIRCRACYDDHPFSPDTVPLHVQRRNEEAVAQREFVPKAKRVDTVLALRTKYRGSGQNVMDKSQGDDYQEGDQVRFRDPTGKVKSGWYRGTKGLKPSYHATHVMVSVTHKQARGGGITSVNVPVRREHLLGKLQKSDAMFELLDDKSPRYHGHEDPIGGKWVHQHDGGSAPHQHTVPRVQPNCCDHPAKDHQAIRDASTQACFGCDDDHNLTGRRIAVETTRHSPSGFKEDMIPDRLPKGIRNMKP